MHVDPVISLGSLVVGFIVGITGVGGGALMTPILVLLFGVPPLAAVSSDLVASVVMKPVGGAVHARQGTVDWEIVRWLALGSVPAAFAGVFLLRLLGNGRDVQTAVQAAVGVALLLAAAAMALRAVITLRAPGAATTAPAGAPHRRIRPAATVAVAILGGVVVGMTSVGSGSLMIVMLLCLYPTLRPLHLVGTALVQAIPLVAAAAIGHLLFGEVQLGVTASLLLGGVPGVFLGARLAARTPGRVISCAICFALFGTGLKLIQLGNLELTLILLGTVVAAPLAWILLRPGGLTLAGGVSREPSVR